MNIGRKKQHIGAHIRKARELQGYSQEYLSECVKISQTTLSRVENGADVLVGKLQEICDVLGVSLIDIIEGDDNNFSLNMTQSNNETAIGVSINRMSEKEQKAYEGHISSLQKENEFLKTTIDKLLSSNKNPKT